MKNLNLETLEVQQMTTAEMQQQGGGGVGPGMLAGLPAALFCGAAVVVGVGVLIGAGIVGLVWYIKSRKK